jgi:hypothetical protein
MVDLGPNILFQSLKKKIFEINGEQVQENWIKNKKKIESRN